MFGIGSKRPPALDRFPTESWTVATGEHEGRPLIVRINAGCRKYVAHPELPCRMGITIAFRSPDERGFPSKVEQAEISELEDQLAGQLQQNKVGYLVAVITTGGQRELVFYVSHGEQASAIVDKAMAATPCRTSYGFQDDPTWASYLQLAP